MSVAKRMGMFGLLGVVGIVVAFGGAALARNNGLDFVSPIMQVLFIIALSSVCAALWTPLLSKSAQSCFCATCGTSCCGIGDLLLHDEAGSE